RSPRPTTHGTRSNVGRSPRQAPPHGQAHHDLAWNGIRSAQEGGRRDRVTGWLGRRALRALHEFRPRLARYHLRQRRAAKIALARDPIVRAAIAQHASEHGLSEADVRRRVDTYIDEIVPQLNVLSYYRIGYNLAKVVLNLLYR